MLKIRNKVDINADLLQWFIHFLIKSLLVAVLKMKFMSNKDLAEELYKPIIRTFENRKSCSLFIDNIWGADLADMPLIRKFNKGFRFLFRFSLLPDLDI